MSGSIDANVLLALRVRKATASNLHKALKSMVENTVALFFKMNLSNDTLGDCSIAAGN